MAAPRRETVDPSVQGIYHCRSRCVRRAFLCGYDALTGKNFDHRKEWMEERLEYLVSIFAIDVLAYAIMDNHLHLALRNNPDIASTWSDLEVVRRWLKLFPARDRKGKPKRQSREAIEAIAEDKDWVGLIRYQLGDISWFMRCLKENIARRANAEDEVTGRFWEGRFKCTRLEDIGATISCMVYIDLNPIRAGKAETPEESEYTSAFRRIAAAECKARRKKKTKRKRTWLCPLEQIQNEGKKPAITLREYLLILDETGRQLKRGKRGAIPAKALPILERISIQPKNWIKLSTKFSYMFPRVAGKPELMYSAAGSCGRQWFKGVSAARQCF